MTYDHTLTLGLEQHATRGDGLRTAVVLLGRTDAGESHLEDADAVEAHLLTQLEEVLHCTAQLVEHGLDVTLLHTRLRLDKVCQLLGLDEMLIVHRRRKPLAVSTAVVVLVLNFLKFLTHLVKVLMVNKIVLLDWPFHVQRYNILKIHFIQMHPN